MTVASTGPNMVAYWDEVAAATITAPPSASDTTEAERFPNTSFDMPSVHVAMYDAAMAIAGTHQPFKVAPATLAEGASMEAALSAAAYGVLKGLFPNRSALYQTKYDAALATIADGAAKTQGIALGTEIAKAMVADRASDGRATVLPAFVPGAEPGQFRGVNPIGRTNQYVKPFSIESASQFRAPGPPALDGAAYAADVNETRDLGGATSTTRTVEQTEAARFNTEPPPRFWSRNLHQFATSQPTLAENARLMALLYVVQADLSIGCFESKYHYLFWRPTSAINLADTDGNPATEADPAWTPVVPTPNHPEYPAAHACTFGGIGEALRSFYGTRRLKFSFDTTVSGISPAGMTHAYESIEDMNNEGLARIWGGMHFRTSVEHGRSLGEQTAAWVVARHFGLRMAAE
ncbi:MAG TPA: vanadium-dependent haloperoxidase [Rubrivivax sp.]|nr:vanadium-dependent haloperoxidase [Rubrivivax sp.]